MGSLSCCHRFNPRGRREQRVAAAAADFLYLSPCYCRWPRRRLVSILAPAPLYRSLQSLMSGVEAELKDTVQSQDARWAEEKEMMGTMIQADIVSKTRRRAPVVSTCLLWGEAAL